MIGVTIAAIAIPTSHRRVIFVVPEYGVLTVQNDEQFACGFWFKVELTKVIFGFRVWLFRQL